MSSSYINYYKKFSHIYIEKEIIDHPNAKNILLNFNKSKIIIIDKYTDIFHRKNQDFCEQKKSQKLILAKKKYDFFYKGSSLCENYGIEKFYYSNLIMNCLYNCSYCYLQGMYNSSNVIIFVNIEDYFNTLDSIYSQNQGKMLIALSYESDLLAFDNITKYVGMCFEYIANKKDILIEIKTKYNEFLYNDEMIPENVIFAWSLLPQKLIDKYETYTPSLKKRIKAINTAIENNAKVRLSIEPVISVDDYKYIYTEFLDYLRDNINIEKIYDINIGAFRMSKIHYNRIKKRDPYNYIFSLKVLQKSSMIEDQNSNKIIEFIKEYLKEYYDEDKIYIYE
ncbi:MAG: radical SAM protein [Eubacteriaceae bacterium]